MVLQVPRPPAVDELARMPSVAEILLLAEIQVGDPEVLAGASALEEPVRVVHIGDEPGDDPLRSGGQLILATAADLPPHPTQRVRWVDDLVAGGASGLVIRRDRPLRSVAPEMITSAERAQLPLITVTGAVSLAAITEAAHALILESQLAGLRDADEVQRAFHLLATAAVSPIDIVEQMAVTAGCPVVLENLAHHVMAASTGGGVRSEGLLADWEHRSRHVTAAGGVTGWLATPVGARGQTWGWVVLLTPSVPTALQRAVAHHGANALAVAQLIGRTGEPLEHQAHQRVLTDLIEHRHATTREAHERTEGLGVPTDGRRLHAVIVRGVGRSPAVVGAAMSALSTAGATAICGVVGDAVGILVSADGRDEPTALLGRVATAVRARFAEADSAGVGRDVRIGVGPEVSRVDDVHRSFVEAADAARAGAVRHGSAYATAADIDLRGLLHLLGEEGHVQRFVERELGPILAHDASRDTNHLQTLVVYLEAGGNKSVAAARSRLSRATFYKHLEQIGAVIGRDLEDAEVRTALHLAVLADRDLCARAAQASSSGARWLMRNGLPSGSRSTDWSAP